MNCGIAEAVYKYLQKGMTSFHTPSHKNFEIFDQRFGDLTQFDTTELCETDNLYEPNGAILYSENFASRVFGAKKTLFSTGGNTLCIQAMLRLCLPRGGRILCARNVHKSAVCAMALLGIDPIWILPDQNNKFGEMHSFSGEVRYESVKTALDFNKNVLGIFVTSPDYYGVISDIKRMSELAKHHNIPLMVDNAHGAHLKFLKKDVHPITLGADLSADSAHKTLPVLTGGAFLQIGNEKFLNDAKSAMAFFGSTSPSFPILSSLDVCCEILNAFGCELFQRLEGRVLDVKERLKHLNLLPNFESADPTRITIHSAKRGILGKDFYDYLRKYKLEAEFYDDHYVVLIPSPFNCEEDWQRLDAALNNFSELEKLAKKGISAPRRDFKYFLPKKIMTLREAMFSKSSFVSVEEAKGRVLAQVLCPAQPSIPPIMPGELLTEREVCVLGSLGAKEVKVVAN